jgi:hypothetical protein
VDADAALADIILAPDGNVGIGTTSPGYSLVVSGSAPEIQIKGNTPRFRLEDIDGGRSDWNLGLDSANNGLNFSETAVADHRLFLEAGGQVGIGTGTPAYKLQVVGTLQTSDNIRAENSSFMGGREDAAAPTYRFHDDGDTGMFNVASNILAFATSGTEQMRILENGNVGIGSTAPVAKLEVSGAIALSSGSITSAPGYTSLWASGSGLYWGDEQVYTNVPGTSEITGGGADTQLAYFTAGANITGSSNYIYNGTNVELTGGHLKFKTNGKGAYFGASTALSIYGSDVASQYIIGYNAGMYIWNQDSAGGTLQLRNDREDYGIQMSISGTEAARFTRVAGQGRLGIGTTSPDKQLHIDAGASSTYLKLTGQSRNAYFGQDSVGLGIYQEANAPMTLYTNNTERITIEGGGNVGIGTTAPAQLLDVSGGSIRGYDGTREVMIKPTNGVAGDDTYTSIFGSNGLMLGTTGDSYTDIWSTGVRYTRFRHATGSTTDGAMTHISGAVTSTEFFRIQPTGNNYDKDAYLYGPHHATLAAGENLQLDANANMTFFYDGEFNVYNDQGTAAPITIRSGSHASMEFEADGDIQFKDNLNKLMILTSGGRLGIGTALPAYDLDIHSTYPRIGLTDTNGITFYIQNQSNHIYFYDVTNAATRLYIEDGGNIGIGSTTPTSMLDVVGTITAGANSYLKIQDNLISGSSGHLELYATDNINLNSYTGITNFNYRGTETFRIGAGASSPVVLQPKASGYDLVLAAQDGTAVLHLDSTDKRIGIGTTSPSYKLDVMGGGRFKESASHQALEVRGDTGYGAYINYVRNNGSWAFRTGMIDNGSRWDITDYRGAGYEALSVTSDLKVGIGITSPAEKLTVGGNGKFLLDYHDTGPASSTEMFHIVTSGSEATFALEAQSTSSGINMYGMIASLNQDINFKGQIWDDMWGAYTDIYEWGWDGDMTAANRKFQFKMAGEYPIHFIQDNSDRLVIASGGNVGIGTVSPGHKLDIVDGHARIYTDNKKMYWGASEDLAIYHSGDHNFISGSTGDIKIQNTANNQDVSLIVNDGGVSNTVLNIRGQSSRVGIGHYAPSAKLDVRETTEQLRLSYDASNYASFTVADDGALTIATVDADAALADIILAPDGNVGIGTTSPLAAAKLTLSDATNTYLNFKPQATHNNWTIGADANGFIFYDETVGGYRMSISDAGNVGIGTTSPNVKLDVVGDARIRGSNKLYFGDTDTTEYISTAGTDDLRIHASDTVLIDGDGKSMFRTPYLALETSAAVEKMRFDIDNGRFGIGTNAPAKWLEVIGDNSLWPIILASGSSDHGTGIQLYNGASGGGSDLMKWSFVAGGSSNSAGPDDSLKFYNETESRYKMLITSGGNVGIGTFNSTYPFTPAGMLHVRASGAASQIILESRSATENYSTGVSLSYGTARAIRFNKHGSNATYGGYSWEIGSADVGGTEIMRLSSEGNLGIGTTAPVGKLEVIGANGTVAGTPDGDAEEIVIRNNHRAGISIISSESSARNSNVTFGSASDMNGANISWSYNLKQFSIQGQNPDAYLRFASANNVEAIRIDSSQNVGIGTTSPSVKLHVIGDALFDGYLHLDKDGSPGLLVGEGGDADIYYDGTDMNINAARIGSGILKIATDTTITGDTTINGNVIVTGSSLAVQQAIKNDISGDTVLSDSYNRYFAQSIAGDAPGANITRLTAPVDPTVGDEYFIVASTYHHGNPPSLEGSAQVTITADSGDTINKTAGAIELAFTASTASATTPNYRTAHLICVDTNTWAMTISDYGPTS